MRLGRFDIPIETLEFSLREVFKNILQFLNEDPFKKGDFRFFTYTAKDAGTFTVPHTYGFQPLDVIELSVSRPDTAAVSWKYDKFTDKNIVFTTTDACTVRAFIGRYKE